MDFSSSASDQASTILGGEGSFRVEAGAGGGVFTGGSAGNNILYSLGGSVTLTGGGNGDYLSGGSAGNNSITAAGGNETLVASAGGNDTLVGSGSGTDAFSFLSEAASKTYTIAGYHVGDLLYLSSTATVSNYDTTEPGGSGTITLGDNTKIVLQSYQGSIDVGHAP